MSVCVIDGCDRPVEGRGWCKRHYRRWERWGDPLGGGPYVGTPLRGHLDWIKERLDAPPDECVLGWPYQVNEKGYPRFHLQGRWQRATHVVLELTGRPRPDPPGNHALHSCDTPLCLNQHHLRWGTNAENVADRDARGRGRGVPPHVTKLTDADRAELRALLALGTHRQADLARRFGVSRSLVCEINGAMRRSPGEF